jgi:hypothetical protein
LLSAYAQNQEIMAARTKDLASANVAGNRALAPHLVVGKNNDVEVAYQEPPQASELRKLLALEASVGAAEVQGEYSSVFCPREPKEGPTSSRVPQGPTGRCGEKLTRFLSAVASLQQNPEDTMTVAAVVLAAQTLAAEWNALVAKQQKLRTSVESDITASVTAANALLVEIGKVTKSINVLPPGVARRSLEASRDQQVLTLAKLVPVRAAEFQRDGSSCWQLELEMKFPNASQVVLSDADGNAGSFRRPVWGSDPLRVQAAGAALELGPTDFYTPGDSPAYNPGLFGSLLREAARSGALVERLAFLYGKANENGAPPPVGTYAAATDIFTLPQFDAAIGAIATALQRFFSASFLGCNTAAGDVGMDAPASALFVVEADGRWTVNAGWNMPPVERHGFSNRDLNQQFAAHGINVTTDACGAHFQGNVSDFLLSLDGRVAAMCGKKKTELQELKQELSLEQETLDERTMVNSVANYQALAEIQGIMLAIMHCVHMDLKQLRQLVDVLHGL